MTDSSVLEDSTDPFRELWSFSRQEIRQGRYDFPIRSVLRSDPGTSLLYAVLCSIHEGISTREGLYEHMDGIFALRLRRPTMTSIDIDEAIQHGLNDNLVQESESRFGLTQHGLETIRYGRLEILHQGYWMKRVLTERSVLILSTLALLLLSSVKIWIGMSIHSDAILTEGIENLTDLLIVGIIAISMRYDRDRLGALAIIAVMIITGALLAVGAIEGLLSNEPVQWSVQAYYVEFLSIVINRILISLKVMVGRSSGNLALIGDAKEDTSHIKVAFGVIIGLTFSILGYYFVDRLVALAISGIILWEGISTIIELQAAGDEIDVDTIRLGANEMYEDLMTYWVLGRLVTGPKTPEVVQRDFLRGVNVGHRYFDFQAVIGFHDIEQRGIMKNVRQAERSGLIAEREGRYSITNRGLAWFYRTRARDLAELARDFSAHQRERYVRAAIMISIFIVIFLLMYYADPIKQIVDDIVASLGFG
ncbi:MAG: cation diffusion facilitator family transporter [Promethearchaeota archaeon]